MERTIVTVDGKPAYEAFKGRVTQSMIEQYGSYQAARKAMLKEQRADNPTPREA